MNLQAVALLRTAAMMSRKRRGDVVMQGDPTHSEVRLRAAGFGNLSEKNPCRRAPRGKSPMCFCAFWREYLGICYREVPYR